MTIEQLTIYELLVELSTIYLPNASTNGPMYIFNQQRHHGASLLIGVTVYRLQSGEGTVSLHSITIWYGNMAPPNNVMSLFDNRLLTTINNSEHTGSFSSFLQHIHTFDR